jgi:DNA-binding NarL/FixJ family response regulator
MERPLSILLIEDDPHECQKMVEQMESVCDVHLVGVTNNIIKALEYVTDSLPDAVILDLELHKGCGNGLTFLDSLRELNLCIPIYVLVTTNNISHIMHNSVRKMGADFIMLKSQEDYNPKMVIDFLVSLKSIIQSNRKSFSHSNNTESGEQRRQKNISRLNNELDRIGISPNATGRKYLSDAIMMVVNGQLKKLHESIGEKYTKTETSVERAMQNAIAKAWKTSHPDDLEKYYTARISSAKGAPTVMEFIHYYARKIRGD